MLGMLNGKGWLVVPVSLCGLIMLVGCGQSSTKPDSSNRASQLRLCVSTWNRSENYLRPAMAHLIYGPQLTGQRASVQYDETRGVCAFSVRWNEGGGGAYSGAYWTQDLIAHPGRSDIAVVGPDVVGGTDSAAGDRPDYKIGPSNATIARNGVITLTSP